MKPKTTLFKNIKIAIVDDQALVAVGFAQIISNLFNFDVPIVADSYNDLIEKMNSTEIVPDIIMLDIQLSEIDGIDAAILLKQQYKNIKILLFSSFKDIAYTVRAIEAGVSGYINKCDSLEELKKALEDTYTNGVYFNKNYNIDIISQYVQAGKIIPTSAPKVELSKREKEILKLICEQYSDAEIATKLSLTTYTITTYKRELMKKLDIKKSAGLALYAVKNNLFKL